jgi:oxalate decarboxylase
MSPISRRSMITTAAGGLLTATAAKAQTGEETPQPRRAGHGGSDPGPRNLMRDRQIPTFLSRPRLTTVRCPTCVSHSPTHMSGRRRVGGRGK